MIENFKRAMRGHAAPFCTECNEPMAWVRSDLDKTEPDTIVSFFHCQKCGARKEVRSKIQKPE
jgi:DNA-directed RNA polymerase subunit M/transcription elongation factor TFIIS